MPPSWVSKTLRLPKSTLPARTIAAERPKYIKAVSDDLYSWQKTHGGGQFILHDGPPYANGDLHIGHALNKILKDITCRYQVSKGRQVDFRPGWDCHGLPIELKALQKQKELGLTSNGSTLSASDVRKVARELATETIELQKARFREWAIMADWDNSWCTMDKEYEIRQLETFRLMLGNGQIYRRSKPVYWSPSSRTALAEAELEYNSDHRSTAAYVKFPLHQIPQVIKDLLPNGQDSVAAAVWTTTPWTLPANRAIAVRRNMEYSVLQTESFGVLIVSSSRLSEFESFCPFTSILGKVSGEDLIGNTYMHPFRSVANGPQPIIHADFVTDESGTGLVHIAPGHGMDDYKLCQELGIEPLAPVDDAGLFTDEALPGSDILTGKEVLGAGNKLVLDILAPANMLLHTHKYRHKYPYDWRSKKPVIIRATRQWFADLDGIKETSLEALKNVKFVPSAGFDRLSSFIKSRSEWCISRQRAWGVPIPALYDQSGEAIMTTESISHIISVIRERGIDAWWSDDLVDPAWVAPSLRDRGNLARGQDTMDVWFDSGSSWNEIVKDKTGTAVNSAVADVYLEGSDQHRGWFQSSLLTKVAQLTALGETTAQAPFKILITHGFTLDSKGKKMSKSEGNVISPAQIMDGTLLPPLKGRSRQSEGKDVPVYDGMGPDALRLWVASSDFTHDIVIGEKLLKAINGSLAKLRVTYKLLTGLLDTFELVRKVPFSELCKLDRLAVMQSVKMRDTVDTAYKEHAYHRAVSAINNYVSTDLSAFYIESVKDRCYTDAEFSKSRVHAQSVLWEVYRNLSQALAPITPLLVVEARDHLPQQLQSYDPFRTLTSEDEKHTSIQDISSDKTLEGIFTEFGGTNDITSIWQEVKRIQETARSEKLMGSSLDCTVTLHLPALDTLNDQTKSLVDTIRYLGAELADLFVVSDVMLVTTSEANQENANLRSQTSSSPKWAKHGSFSLGGLAEGGSSTFAITVSAPTKLKCVRCWKYNVSPETVQQKMPAGTSTFSEGDTQAEKSQTGAEAVGSATNNNHAPVETSLKQETQKVLLEEPICHRCLGVLEGLRENETDGALAENFAERPGIAHAAAACRHKNDANDEFRRLYEWNWGFNSTEGVTKALESHSVR